MATSYLLLLLRLRRPGDLDLDLRLGGEIDRERPLCTRGPEAAPPPTPAPPRRRPYNFLLNSLEMGFKCMKLQNPPLVHSPISY